MVDRAVPFVCADRTPVRMCVGCKERAAKSDLLRLVVIENDVASGSPAWRIVPDPASRRLGRGASLHHDLRCLDLAERRRAFPKAFRLQDALDAREVRDYLETPSGSSGSCASA